MVRLWHRRCGPAAALGAAALSLNVLCSGALGAESDSLTGSWKGISVCDLEVKAGLHGSYMPFDKDPDGILLGALADVNGNRYIAVVAKRGEDRCKWSVNYVLPFVMSKSKASGDRPERAFGVAFNCAPLRAIYKSDIVYLGVIDTDQRLEYIQPVEAWALNISTGALDRKPVGSMICPEFFGD